MRIYLFIIFQLLSLQGIVYSQTKPIYSVYLIGDTGDPLLGKPDPVFTSLKAQLDQESENSSLIFLGDNIYHNGLPPEDRLDEDRKKAESKILVQLKAVENFKGKIYFIPGNHDWNNAKKDGIDYIHAQEEFIEFFFDNKDVFLPDHGCPGPEKKKLGDKAVLIAMDSQWWLHPHPDDYSKHNTCKNKDFGDITMELVEMLDEESDKWIIVALHHPLYSEGSHNGFYTLLDHLFPLTVFSSSFYLPLPILGSLHPFYRSVFGAKQDMVHPLYQFYISEILKATEGRKNIMFVSGHEHNLQYFKKDDNHFIKSGSGSKSSPLPSNSEALFSSDHKGFAKIEFYEDRDVRLKYFTLPKNKEELAYDGLLMRQSRSFPKKYEPYELKAESITSSADEQYNKGFIHRLIFGNLYRKDWSTRSNFRTFNISKELGGLTPTQVGGGLSSSSIRLEDSDGKEYVLRSVQKRVEKVVPIEFRSSIIEHIFQDQIAASQPYAALVVPPLAKAAGIYHTTPEIVYLPKQDALGDYNALFASKLYLFEERPAGDMEDNEQFGKSKKIVSFSKLLTQLKTDNRNHIHQDQVLRSRLMDIYLGDWDRHDDQWRWASFEERADDGSGRKEIYYEPIPRDRDQVFFKYKGLTPTIAKLLAPELRKFQSFGPNIKNLKYLGYNARHFDRSFLNAQDKESWIKIAQELKANITDKAIDESVNKLPHEIKEFRAEYFKKSLLARRDKLPSFAEKHYAYLAKYVDIPGSDKEEYFEVLREDSGVTQIRVYDLNKDREADELIYSRQFISNETKEIRLYGLGGNDQFVLSGEHTNGSLIRIIGGEGKDRIQDNSVNRGSTKSLIVYDNINEKNDFKLGPDSQDLRSDNYKDNHYDRKEYYFDSNVGFVLLGYTPDDGLIINYRQNLIKYGFRKNPFDIQHSLNTRIALGSKEFKVAYELIKSDVLKSADFNLDFELSLPNDVTNFFGLGNEQKISISDFSDFNIFRYKTTEVILFPSLSISSKHGFSNLKFGPYFQYVNLKDNEGKYLVTDSGLPDSELEDRHYVGIKLDYKLERVNSSTFPEQGIRFNLAPSYNLNLKNSDERFLKLWGSLVLYNYLWVPKSVVLATKIETGINFGNFGFLQAHYIGQENGLRAYRDNRFGGKAAFIVSNDIRIKVRSHKNAFVPYSWGLIGSYDFGRVWLGSENSNRWHRSIGAGFWVNPFDILPISFYFLNSNEEESNFLIKFGFAF